MLQVQVGRVFFRHGSQITGDDAIRDPQISHPAIFQPQRPVADRFHVPDIMRDEQNRDPLRPQFVHFTHTALAEVDIADRQRFIHDQDFGIYVNGDREGQPDCHATRIGFYGLIDEARRSRRTPRSARNLRSISRREKPRIARIQVDILAAR